MALLMMNGTAKPRNRVNASGLHHGVSTGVRMRMVGMSIAVPTIITSRMMAISGSVWLPMKGSSMPMILLGRSATVMSQADTMAAATRKTSTALVRAAAWKMSASWRELVAVHHHGDEQGVRGGHHGPLRSA